MENQTNLLETTNQNFDIYQKLIPDVGQAYDALPSEVYKDDELKGKIKRLMGMAAALTYGCRACILFQTDEALKLGASVDEVLETYAVAISIDGTMAAGETTRVVKFFEEKGLM